MINPSIKELQNEEKFELVAVLEHQRIKEFVFEQLAKGGTIIKLYMYYQILMIVSGIFFVSKSVVAAFKGTSEPFIYILWAALFTFTILIIIHELLHGVALKFTGAKKIHFGAYLKKFIFYAEANRFVVNKKQFLVIALTPLFVVKMITIIGVFLFFYSPLMYFFIFVMSAHSLFCAGDIALLSIFYSFGNDNIFSFDEKEEKKSYYFRLKT